jgi:hypothetical protein
LTPSKNDLDFAPHDSPTCYQRRRGKGKKIIKRAIALLNTFIERGRFVLRGGKSPLFLFLPPLLDRRGGHRGRGRNKLRLFRLAGNDEKDGG